MGGGGGDSIIISDFIFSHRYMMSFPDKKVLRRAELDAFITTAIMPELMNADLNQELQVCIYIFVLLAFCLYFSILSLKFQFLPKFTQVP